MSNKDTVVQLFAISGQVEHDKLRGIEGSPVPTCSLPCADVVLILCAAQ